jgi:hypothetical protein
MTRRGASGWRYKISDPIVTCGRPENALNMAFYKEGTHKFP